ncbi:MAG: oxidoreductase [Nitrospirales bacterium]|nr:MAG: oxidoreductase [Nitrospirales bacterium]
MSIVNPFFAEPFDNLVIPEKFQELKSKKMLVTGAAGFIGGALFRRLAAYGCDVTGTVLYPHEAEAFRKNGFKAEVLDLSSDDPFEPFLEGQDLVFHVAAMFRETEHGEKLYNKVDHHGALKLCKVAAAVGVERFVHCSTIGVHGDVLEIPCKETTPFNPTNHYTRAKLRGELAIIEFANTLPNDGMVVTVNRPAIVYGPGDTRMLMLFKAVLQKKFLMIGFGTVLSHPGYIEDQVDSFLLCAIAPREKVHLEAFNIASDQPIPVREFAQLIADKGGVTIPKIRIPSSPLWYAGLVCEAIFMPLKLRPPLFRRRVGYFRENRAFDLTKAKERLGYVSQWDHKTGVSTSIDWYRKKDMI